MADKSEKIVATRLVECTPRPPQNWHQFLMRWNKYAKDDDILAMLGLLHGGRSFPFVPQGYGEVAYDEVDRDVFYLSIADGWNTEDLRDGDRDDGFPAIYLGGVGYSYRRQLRSHVARKAFDVLCQTFFKLEGPDRDPDLEKVRGRRGEIASERLLLALQDFFRIEKSVGEGYHIRNLRRFPGGHTHGEEMARGFLFNLVQLVWGWEKASQMARGAAADNLPPRDRLEKAKPWAIDVLSILGKLDVLYEHELDRVSLKHIRDIAMQTRLSSFRHPVSNDRRVATLDEACYAGSQAAIFLRTYESNRAERRRLQAVLEAERRLKAAKREVENLSGQK